jgi:hypothetical protein
MFRKVVPVRVLAVMAVGALTVGALALRPQPAAAQVPEFTAYNEYLISTPTVTRTQPSLSAPVYTTLQANQVVYVINRFFTPDGIYWFQLRDPAGNYLGFVPVSGPGVGTVPFRSLGTNVVIGGFPQFVTGVSPFVNVTPFISPFTIIPRQIFPRQTPIFVPSVGFYQ